MFPVFSAVFPVCSQSGSMNSLRSQCSGFPATTHIHAVVSLWPYLQPPGTLGTLGTRLTRHELGSVHMWNRRGTLGTGLAKAYGCAEPTEDLLEGQVPKLDAHGFESRLPGQTGLRSERLGRDHIDLNQNLRQMRA